MSAQLERRCIVCGAEPKKTCVSCSDHSYDPNIEPDDRLRGLRKGVERPVPHFYR